jgi:dTDP-4-amino-4,6-dideoxygalactose transaminase
MPTTQNFNVSLLNPSRLESKSRGRGFAKMIPRNRPDIVWRDLAYGIGACLWPLDRLAQEQRVVRAWSPSPSCLVSLSVRSGFDRLLEALDLPAGSEILVSAVTIRDMPRIIQQHGLVPVPVDLNMQTLTVKPDCLERAITARTRAILVAHLFGSHMALDQIVSIARAHGLFIIEDCAQAYAGQSYPGHPASDVIMFSFGPIKTSTALGGGILQFKDQALLARVKGLQARDPVQSRRRFLVRLCQYVLLRALTHPRLFGVFAGLCQWRGTTHDAVMSASLRGFPGPDFFAAIRHQPCAPLLALLARRLEQFDPAGIERRERLAREAIALLPYVGRPGGQCPDHTYWVFPILIDAPEELMHWLWQAGFDATRGASSLSVVEPPADWPELELMGARQAMRDILYVPINACLSAGELRQLAALVNAFDAHQPRPDRKALVAA